MVDKRIFKQPSSGKARLSDGSQFDLAEYYRRSQDNSGGIIYVPLEHAKIHRGNGWESSIETGNISASANYDVLIKVVEGKAHLRAYSATVSEGPCMLRLYEGPTVSNEGSIHASRNRNRAFDDENGVEVYTGPTISDVGTRLETSFIPGAGNKVGGNTESLYEEWVFDEEYYLLRLTNNTNGIVTAVINLFWYLEE